MIEHPTFYAREQLDPFRKIQGKGERASFQVVAALTDHILPLAPGLRDQLQAGVDVLDIGCGAGAVSLAAAPSREQIATRHFSAANCSAQPRPRPRLAAVTKATFRSDMFNAPFSL